LNPRWRLLDQNALARQNTPALHRELQANPLSSLNDVSNNPTLGCCVGNFLIGSRTPIILPNRAFPVTLRRHVWHGW